MSYRDRFGRRAAALVARLSGGEEHFMRILDAVTHVPAHVDEHNIMALDDPEMFKFPVI